MGVFRNSHRIHQPMPALLLERNAIKALIKMSDVINVMEEAFGTCGRGSRKAPTRTGLVVDRGDFRAMRAALHRCEGVKMGKRTPRKSIWWSTSV